MYIKRGINFNRMINFINKFINGKYKNKLIILDNVYSHSNQKVNDVIKKIIIYYIMFYINIIQL
jgi:hypothetical protein